MKRTKFAGKLVQRYYLKYKKDLSEVKKGMKENKEQKIKPLIR